MTERRKEQRVISTFKSAYVRATNGLHFVTLRNISDSGVCFDAYPGVAVGEQIEFCFDSTGPKSGAVKWIENGRFGVSADSGIILPECILFPHRSRSVRLPLSFRAELFTLQGCSQVMVHNLSTRGACIDFVYGLQRGQLVSIKIGDRSFELACVRWIDGAHAGIGFAEPVARSEFRDLVDKLQNRPIAAGSGESAPDRLQELVPSSHDDERLRELRTA